MQRIALVALLASRPAFADDARLADTSSYIGQLTSSPASPSSEDPEPVRWMVLGAAFAPGGDPTRGVRLELDLFGFGPFAIGASASFYDYADTTDLLQLEAAAAVTGSLHHSYRGWHLRGFGGVGLSFASSRLASEVTTDSTTAVGPMLELGLRVGRDLVGGWVLAAGPTYTITRGSTMDVETARTTMLVGLGRRW